MNTFSSFIATGIMVAGIVSDAIAQGTTTMADVVKTNGSGFRIGPVSCPHNRERLSK